MSMKKRPPIDLGIRSIDDRMAASTPPSSDGGVKPPRSAMGRLAATTVQHRERSLEEARAEIQRLQELLDQQLSATAASALVRIKVSEIRPSRIFINRLEEEFESPEFQELRESIRRERGNKVPVRVRPLESDPDGYKYEFIAGERRARACELEGIEEVEAKVEKLDEIAAQFQKLTDNLQRSDVAPLAMAFLIQQMVDASPTLTFAAVAEACGKSKTWATRVRSLLSIPVEIRGTPEKPGLIKDRRVIGVMDGYALAQRLSADKRLTSMIIAKANEIEDLPDSDQQKWSAILAVKPGPTKASSKGHGKEDPLGKREIKAYGIKRAWVAMDKGAYVLKFAKSLDTAVIQRVLDSVESEITSALKETEK